MKMSKLLKTALMSTAVAASFAAGSAHAAYTVDTLLGSANLGNSGDATELAAFQAFVPGLTGPLTKVEGSSVIAFQNPGTTDEWYIDVGSATPGYFLLKFGTGGTGATADTFFFQNIGEVSKLVWNNSQVQFLTGGDCGANNESACNIGRLSHYSYGGEGDVPGGGGEVPEPASLALIGLGLAGLAARRRK